MKQRRKEAPPKIVEMKRVTVHMNGYSVKVTLVCMADRVKTLKQFLYSSFALLIAHVFVLLLLNANISKSF